MIKQPKSIYLLLLHICIVIMLSLLVSCSQGSLTAVPTAPVTPTQNIDAATFTPAPSPTLPNPTLTAFIVPRERPPFLDALFTVLSDDQTQLLAAYEGMYELQILHQLPPSRRTQVTSYPAGFPVISDDGVWVTVLEDYEGFSVCIYRVALVGPDEPHCILSWPGIQLDARISADGKRVVFQAMEEDCEIYRQTGDYFSCLRHVYVMDSDGGNVKRISAEPADRCAFAWSANNTQLVYQEVCNPAASSPSKIYVVTLEPFNTPRQITEVAVNALFPRWLPNGNWLEWHTHRPNKHYISQLDTEGRIIAEVEIPADYAGAWCPDGEKLAMLAHDITIWDITSGEITTFELPGIRPSSPQRWLPNGSGLIFAGYRVDSQGELEPGSKWFIVNIDGTNPIEFSAP